MRRPLGAAKIRETVRLYQIGAYWEVWYNMADGQTAVVYRSQDETGARRYERWARAAIAQGQRL